MAQALLLSAMVRTRHDLLNRPAIMIMGNKASKMVALVAVIVGCYVTVGRTEEKSKYPATLEEAVRVFRAADPSDRYEQGRRLEQVFPKCPLAASTNTGTGVILMYDYSRPSYVLSTNDVLKLLGAPLFRETHGNATSFSYRVGKALDQSEWLMDIEFRKNHVVMVWFRVPDETQGERIETNRPALKR